MIVSHILGGLGNQMFQYAYGRCLADHLQVPFYLDLHDFQAYELHAYQLDAFPHRGQPLPKRLEGCRPTALSGLRMRWAAAVPARLRRTLRPVRERPFGFASRYLRVTSGSYLYGYWQSEKFFHGHRETLLRDFAFQTTELSELTRQLAGELETQPSVFLHVRRGDYVTDPQARKVYLSLGRDYYRGALNTLLQQYENLRGYVFTNDPAWCHANLDLGMPLTVVQHNTAVTCHEDLYLMSRCQHGVIANSTFSWWGAYLMQHPARRVFCPARWTHAETGRDDSHLPADGWDALPVSSVASSLLGA